MEALGHFFRMIKFEHRVFALPLAYVGAILGAGGWPDWKKALLILGAMVRSAHRGHGVQSVGRPHLRPPKSPHEQPGAPGGKAPKARGDGAPLRIHRAFSRFRAGPRSLVLLSLPIGPFGGPRIFLHQAVHLDQPSLLGLALAFAPMGYLAVAGRLDWPVILIAAGVICWVAGFDVIYACQDIGFDRRAGLHSIPVRVGTRRALHFSSAIHLAAFALFLWGGILAELGWPYFAAVLIVGLLLVLEHRMGRARKNSTASTPPFSPSTAT